MQGLATIKSLNAATVKSQAKSPWPEPIAAIVTPTKPIEQIIGELQSLELELIHPNLGTKAPDLGIL